MPQVNFTEADTELMVALINQIGTGNIDYKKLGQELGITKQSTISMRVCRFREKLAKSGAGEKIQVSKKANGTSPKKRKISGHEDIEGGDDETPPRKLPGRKARVKSFKEEDEEDDEVDEPLEEGQEV